MGCHKLTYNDNFLSLKVVYSKPPTVKPLYKYKYQWDLIHNPEGGLYLFQDEEEGAYKPITWLSSIIEEIRCARFTEAGNYKISNSSVLKKEIIEDNTVTVIGKNFTRIVAELIDKNQASINVNNIEVEGANIFIGEKNSGLKLTVYGKNLYEDSESASWLWEYLTVSRDKYNGQLNTLLVELARASHENFLNELLQLPVCILNSLSAEWRFVFFEKLINQDETLTEREAICINRLFSTVKDESQASALIASIKDKGYEYQLIKSIDNFRSDVFNSIASGLSRLFYSQNSGTLIEEGKKVDDVDFFLWQPAGNAQKMSDAFLNDPSFSTWYDMMYNSWTYTYTVSLSESGKFDVKSHGTAFSHLGPKSNIVFFEIYPFATVSVYFAQKNKLIGIEDHTVVMPGILLAWLIDQGEREANKIMRDIAITAASFYFPATALRNAYSAGKYYAVAWNAFILSKELADKMLESEQIRFAVRDYFGYNFVESFIKLSNLLDCTLMFRGFFKDEIEQSTIELINQFNNIANSNKESFQNEFPDVYNNIKMYLDNLNSEL